MKNNFLLKVRKPLINPCHKLICLHHAGGGASSFYTWFKFFDGMIEVAAVQFPGREERINDKLCDNREGLIEELVVAVKEYVGDNKFSVFGHSMGGVFGYEIVKRLEQKHNLKASQCFISSSKLWNMGDILSKSVDDYSDEDFLAAVSAYGGIDEEFFRIEEFRIAFLSILRADFKLLEGYTPSEPLTISIPILFMYGTEDRTLKDHQIEKWKQITTKECIYYAFGGGHFYLTDHKKEVCDYIRQRILCK
ncbi:alpha/beta fold hydrolase [Lachnospiraceae bacterium ZAX-1]